MFTRALAILPMLFALCAQAEIYSWVDEDGDRHFGDKVPAQYQNQANSVDQNVYRPRDEEVQAAEARYRESRKVTRRIERSRQEADRQRQLQTLLNRKTKAQPTHKAQQSEYERKLSEYNESVECFKSCRIEIPRYQTFHHQDGTSYTTQIGVGYDISNCGHCKNLPKPEK